MFKTKILCDGFYSYWLVAYVSNNVHGLYLSTGCSYHSNKNNGAINISNMIFMLVAHLPNEGASSKREFALYVVKQIDQQLDKQIYKCIDVVRRKIQDPLSISDNMLRNAQMSAWDSIKPANVIHAAHYAACSTNDIATHAYFAADAVAKEVSNTSGPKAKRQIEIQQLHKLIEMIIGIK